MIRFAIETVPAVASTNDLVADRARAGAVEGLVIRAEAQTAGRGRQGRHWQSPRGNLYASLLLRPHRQLHEAFHHRGTVVDHEAGPFAANGAD